MNFFRVIQFLILSKFSVPLLGISGYAYDNNRGKMRARIVSHFRLEVPRIHFHYDVCGCGHKLLVYILMTVFFIYFLPQLYTYFM